VSLTATQRKALRRLGHDRKPVVLVGGAGLSATVLAEIERALDSHELIKVRVRTGERDDRDALIAAMCTQAGAELVQRVGHVALLYRRNPETAKIVLPESSAADSGA
jgi:RNA-binding protein